VYRSAYATTIFEPIKIYVCGDSGCAIALGLLPSYNAPKSLEKPRGINQLLHRPF
jgi:hypothetical protein